MKQKSLEVSDSTSHTNEDDSLNIDINDRSLGSTESFPTEHSNELEEATDHKRQQTNKSEYFDSADEEAQPIISDETNISSESYSELDQTYKEPEGPDIVPKRFYKSDEVLSEDQLTEYNKNKCREKLSDSIGKQLSPKKLCTQSVRKRGKAGSAKYNYKFMRRKSRKYIAQASGNQQQLEEQSTTSNISQENKDPRIQSLNWQRITKTVVSEVGYK